MNYYYKYANQEDTLFGEGFAYVEYGENLEPLRQVEDYGRILLYSYINPHTCKQAGTCYLSETDLNQELELPENVIAAATFEQKWLQAQLFSDRLLDIDRRRDLTSSTVQEIIAGRR
ncbi:hypothetical protein GCM10027175_14200 [Hymenobacter latericoloratus]